MCNYIFEFPDDASYGDRLKISITRLAGADVYIGLGKEYDREMFLYNFDNDDSISDDLAEFDGRMACVYPLKMFVSVQSRPTCCAEFYFSITYHEKAKERISIEGFKSAYNEKSAQARLDQASDETFLLVAWLIIGLQFFLIFALAALICYYVREYTRKSDVLSEAQRKQDMSQLNLLENQHSGSQRRSSQKFLSPAQLTARRNASGLPDMDELAIVALTEEIDR